MLWCDYPLIMTLLLMQLWKFIGCTEKSTSYWDVLLNDSLFMQYNNIARRLNQISVQSNSVLV